MKTCKHCNQEKPLTDYPRNKLMKSGFLNICKACAYEAHKKRRQTEEGKAARKKEKQYPDAKRRYKQSEKGKAVQAAYKRDPSRTAAKNAVRYAIQTNKLTRLPCEICGANAHAHHSSYAQDMRLAVTWLCQSHHNLLHIEFENKKSWIHA